MTRFAGAAVMYLWHLVTSIFLLSYPLSLTYSSDLTFSQWLNVSFWKHTLAKYSYFCLYIFFLPACLSLSSELALGIDHWAFKKKVCCSAFSVPIFIIDFFFIAKVLICLSPNSFYALTLFSWNFKYSTVNT